MMVPPLSELPVTEEDEERFRRESMPRKYTLRQRWADYRADARANRPKGVKARVRAWLHVEPFYWGCAPPTLCLSLGQSSPSTSTGLPTVGGTRGARNPPSQPPRRPPRSLHRWRRVPPMPRCRAATRSDPTACSCAPPNTPHPPTPNQNYPKKPKKTQNEAQKRQQSTTWRPLHMHGTPEIHCHWKQFLTQMIALETSLYPIYITPIHPDGHTATQLLSITF